MLCFVLGLDERAGGREVGWGRRREDIFFFTTVRRALKTTNYHKLKVRETVATAVLLAVFMPLSAGERA